MVNNIPYRYDYHGGTMSRLDKFMAYYNSKSPIVKIAKSPAYFRMIAAGFIFGEVSQEWGERYTGHIVCVCGRVEHYSIWNKDIRVVNTQPDIASVIEAVGAISARHLKRDGFTHQQIKEIRKAYV